MLDARVGNSKYKLLCHRFDSTRVRNQRFKSHNLPTWDVGAQLVWPPHLVSFNYIAKCECLRYCLYVNIFTGFSDNISTHKEDLFTIFLTGFETMGSNPITYQCGRRVLNSFGHCIMCLSITFECARVRNIIYYMLTYLHVFSILKKKIIYLCLNRLRNNGLKYHNLSMQVLNTFGHLIWYLSITLKGAGVRNSIITCGHIYVFSRYYIYEKKVFFLKQPLHLKSTHYTELLTRLPVSNWYRYARSRTCARACA